MHIDAVPNRTSRQTYLLRASYRQGKKVRKRTLANLSALSDEQIEAIRAVLAGVAVRPVEELFEVVRSRAHGAVQAVRVAMQRLGFEGLIASRASPERERVCAMVAARVLEPHTKLATTRWWHTTTLAEEYGVQGVPSSNLGAPTIKNDRYEIECVRPGVHFRFRAFPVAAMARVCAAQPSHSTAGRFTTQHA